MEHNEFSNDMSKTLQSIVQWGQLALENIKEIEKAIEESNHGDQDSRSD